MKKAAFFALLTLFFAYSGFSADFIDGRIKLVLNPNNGRFSLYYKADMAREEFTPLFASQDPRTSFLSLIVNNRTYKLGESPLFKTSIGGTASSPSLVFESSFIRVSQNFSFIKTGSSSLSNGVLITIIVTNKIEQTLETGLRLLLDTELGERGTAHFNTNLREINNETVISNSSAEQYWISKNSKLGLMGSITGQNQQDMIHFANWKRLNDAPWKITFMSGRNFNFLPYSIDDSAVCYYFEPLPLPKGGFRIASLSLICIPPGTGESIAVFNNSNTNTRMPNSAGSSITGKEFADSLKADIIILQDLLFRLNESIVSRAKISDDELSAISLLISTIKLKYSVP